METNELKRLFNPESIAVIGATENKEKIGYIVFSYINESKCKVYPVNPKYKSINGVKCYTNLKEIENDIDLAVIVLPAEQTLEALQECVEKGVRFVIPIASNFSETGEEGKKREEKLKLIIKGTSTRVLGPNTLGIFVPNVVDTMFVVKDRCKRPPKGSIAFVSQSGATAACIMDSCSFWEIGFSAFVGLGNKADLNECDFIEYFNTDPSTNVIVLYLEGFADGKRFLNVAKASKKPIVLLMAGRSTSGSRAASSHTGAMATSSKIVDGVARQANITRVYGEEEMVDIALAYSKLGPTNGKSVAIITSAGGFGVISTDHIEEDFSLNLAQLSPQTMNKLKEVLPEFASVKNPIDITAVATNDMIDKTLHILKEEKNIDIVLVIVLFQSPGITEKLVDILVKHTKSIPLVTTVIGSELADMATKELIKNGVPSYFSTYRAARAIAKIMR